MLQHPHPTPPAPGRRLEVAPGVFWLRMPLPFALDHINLWLLEDGEGYTAIDTGFAADNVRAAWEEILAALDGRPLKRIVVTHFHPDHLGLAAWLSEMTGAPIWMSAGEFLSAHLVWHQLAGHGVAEMIDFFRQHGLDDSRLSAFDQRGNSYRKGVPQLPATYHRLQGGDRITIGGNCWQIQSGFGHAPEHLSLYCPELAVLISGDMLLPRITTNISVFAVTPDADNLGRYLHSLEGWRDLPDETLVLPAHGLPFRGAQERINVIDAHHAERLQRIVDACERPQTATELLPCLFERALDTHQTMFAMGEAIAHLNHLHDAGRLMRTRDADGIIRFTRSTPNP
jgi:glyoxylase-like metal-dependent hydrolase (beta-lactamase superfamily II)